MIKQLPCTWTDEYKSFDWRETYVLDEVPLDDVWDNFATKARLELDKFHRSNGVVKECTKHYMSFMPELSPEFAKVLDGFKNYQFSYNFLKLTGSYNIPMHYDSYSTFVKRTNVTEEQAKHIKRTAIMITPWAAGQVIQIGDEVMSHWSPGTAYTWVGDMWHGAGNFGFSDMVLMQVTWL